MIITRQDCVRSLTMLAALAAMALPMTCRALEGKGTLEEKGVKSLLQTGTTVTITPNESWSESTESFDIIISLGEKGLSSKHSMGMVCGSYIDRWNYSFPSQWWGQNQPWQTNDPGAPNYVTAQCSRSDVKVRLSIGEYEGKKPYRNQQAHFVRSLRERMRYVLEIETDTDL